MAVKLAVAKRKNGDELHLKTSMTQVVGLSDALAAKQEQLTQAQLDAVNSGVTTEVVGEVSAIKTLIPGQATETNQLADKDFVNSTVETMSAAKLCYDAEGNPFPTKSALDNATVFYHGESEKEPDEHDFCTVLEDEEHGGAQTRYSFSNGIWAFQYLVNDQPFTAAQNAAIDSGITAGKVSEYDVIVTGMGDYLKTSDAATTYATKGEVEGLGTVYFVQPGADLSGFGDEDLFIEVYSE